jgi:hypothetical protein
MDRTARRSLRSDQRPDLPLVHADQDSDVAQREPGA